VPRGAWISSGRRCSARCSPALTMPASAWPGCSDSPGEVAGFGPVDADACRDLAQRLAAGPGTRWCLTLTGQDGRAVVHGCACAGPGPATSGCRQHLAGVGDDPAAGARQMRPRTSGSVVPVRPDAAAPDRHPPPDLRVPRLPPLGRAMRRRPCGAARPGRGYLRMQPGPAVQTPSPDKTGIRLEPGPTRTRRSGLDGSARPQLPGQAGPLSGLNRREQSRIE